MLFDDFSRSRFFFGWLQRYSLRRHFNGAISPPPHPEECFCTSETFVALSLFTKSIFVICLPKMLEMICAPYFFIYLFLSVKAFAEFSRVRRKDHEDIVESLEHLMFPWIFHPQVLGVIIFFINLAWVHDSASSPCSQHSGTPHKIWSVAIFPNFVWVAKFAVCLGLNTLFVFAGFRFFRQTEQGSLWMHSQWNPRPTMDVEPHTICIILNRNVAMDDCESTRVVCLVYELTWMYNVAVL